MSDQASAVAPDPTADLLAAIGGGDPDTGEERAEEETPAAIAETAADEPAADPKPEEAQPR